MSVYEMRGARRDLEGALLAVNERAVALQHTLDEATRSGEATRDAGRRSGGGGA